MIEKLRLKQLALDCSTFDVLTTDMYKSQIVSAIDTTRISLVTMWSKH
jgi:hypothetical protein